MEAQLKANGLENEIKVVKTGCFGLCALGPIMIVYPEGCFYSEVKVEDIPEIKVGDVAVVKIHINLEATGMVKMTFNNTESTVNIINGDGTVTLEGLSEGTYTVDVNFLGDTNFAAKILDKINKEIIR